MPTRHGYTPQFLRKTLYSTLNMNFLTPTFPSLEYKLIWWGFFSLIKLCQCCNDKTTSQPLITYIIGLYQTHVGSMDEIIHFFCKIQIR